MSERRDSSRQAGKTGETRAGGPTAPEDAERGLELLLAVSHCLRSWQSFTPGAERLLKLVAIAAHAAAVTLQLLQARDGRSGEPASLAFTADELGTLDAIHLATALLWKEMRRVNLVMATHDEALALGAQLTSWSPHATCNRSGSRSARRVACGVVW